MFRFLLVATLAFACAQARSNPGDAHAETVKYANDIHEDGSYQWDLQTSNGISAQESGVGGHHSTGGYAYYSPEGQLIQVSYLADENGFQPSGAHLPTPPPIPAAILRSLEYIRTHPQYEERQGAAHQQSYRAPASQHRFQSFRG